MRACSYRSQPPPPPGPHNQAGLCLPAVSPLRTRHTGRTDSYRADSDRALGSTAAPSPAVGVTSGGIVSIKSKLDTLGLAPSNPCSPTSQVLCCRPTPRGNSTTGVRLLTFPVASACAVSNLHRLLPEVSRFSRGECPHMPSSLPPPEQDTARLTLCPVLPSRQTTNSASGSWCFRSSIARLCFPLFTLPHALTGSSRQNSRPVWLAKPSPQDSFIRYSPPILIGAFGLTPWNPDPVESRHAPEGTDRSGMQMESRPLRSERNTGVPSAVPRRTKLPRGPGYRPPVHQALRGPFRALHRPPRPPLKATEPSPPSIRSIRSTRSIRSFPSHSHLRHSQTPKLTNPHTLLPLLLLDPDPGPKSRL